MLYPSDFKVWFKVSTVLEDIQDGNKYIEGGGRWEDEVCSPNTRIGARSKLSARLIDAEPFEARCSSAGGCRCRRGLGCSCCCALGGTNSDPFVSFTLGVFFGFEWEN